MAWGYTVTKGGRGGEARKVERSLKPSFLVSFFFCAGIDALLLEEKLAFNTQRAYCSVK